MTGPLTGRKVLLLLAGFFGIVIATNAWFVILSVKSFHGEDEQRPYLQGISYNQTLARRAEQKALDWRAEISVADRGTDIVRLRLKVARPDGAPVENLQLRGELRHPADEHHDRVLALRAVAPGIYEADVVGAGKGWRDALIRTAAGTSFEMERRLWLP
jgi:nitrogen fixation protein FixH